MNTKDYSIATITWARDEHEEILLRQALTYLAALQIEVFITDGGSSAAFLEFLKGFPNFHFTQLVGQGLWAQAQKSLESAKNSKASFVLYTEPDKLDFFKQLHLLLDNSALNESLGILLASRSKKAFETFPAFQQMTETTINNCCTEVIGKAVDFTYGPFLINSVLIPDLVKIEDKLGWGWRPYAFVLSHLKGYDIKNVEGDFYCPIDQTDDTPKERLYRMHQLKENIDGILLASKNEGIKNTMP